MATQSACWSSRMRSKKGAWLSYSSGHFERNLWRSTLVVSDLRPEPILIKRRHLRGALRGRRHALSVPKYKMAAPSGVSDFLTALFPL